MNFSALPKTPGDAVARALILAFHAAFLLAPDALGAEAARQLGRVKVKALDEISGIAVSRLNPNIVWMHNDGDSKQIYAVRTSGVVSAQLRAPRGIQDLEDIALSPGPDSDRDHLYLGDIGDNDGDRRTIQVFRFLEPLLGSSGQEYAEEVEVITLIYPDGAHDAEALLVDPATGDIVIATKKERGAHIYLAAGPEAEKGQPIVLRNIATLDLNEISAGDISRDGQLIAFRSEQQGWIWERRGDEPLEEVLLREPQTISVLGRKQGKNGEAIAFADDGKSYFTMSEGKNESLYSFPVPNDVR